MYTLNRIILSIIFTTSFLMAFSNNWVTIQINNLVQLDFPDTPKVEIVNGRKFFSNKDSLQGYLAFAIPKIYYNNNDKVSDIYDHFTNGIIDGLPKKGGYLIGENNFVVEGLTGRELYYITNKNTSEESENMTRILFVNGTLYNYSHTFLKSHHELVTNNDKFFNSLMLSHNHHLSQDINIHGFAYILAGLTFYFLLFCIIGLPIVLFFVFRNRKKKTSI